MDREQLTEDLPVGGQAVIEGVMMRVPGKIVTAVRKPDDEIVVRESDYVSLAKRAKLFDIPVLRGGIAFFEMMIIGMKALNFSAEVAMKADEEAKAAANAAGAAENAAEEAEAAGEEVNPVTGANAAADDEDSWKNRLSLALTLVVSFGLGITLFFFLPLYVAQLTGAQSDAVHFNLVAGLVRMTLLLGYLWGVSHWKEIQRVFQYHGAEHKSIFTLEAGDDLTVPRAREFGRLHPRCGTSFLLIVVLLSIIVFALADSAFPLVFGHAQSLLQRFATHLCFLPLIAGISFELLKFSGKKRNHPITRVLIAPGLWLQRITTSEPSDDQLEVALVALRHALGEPAQTEYSLIQ